MSETTTEERTYIVPMAEDIAAFRRQYVMSKIIAGYTTNQQIADAWNEDHPAFMVMAGTIGNDRRIANNELQVQTMITAKQARAIISARLDTVSRILLPLVERGHLGAIEKYQRNEAQQAALWGANMPVKMAYTDPTGTKSASNMSDEERLQRLTDLANIIKMRKTGEAPQIEVISARTDEQD